MASPGSAPRSFPLRLSAAAAFACGSCAPFAAFGLVAGSSPWLANHKAFYLAAGSLAILLGLKRALAPPACRLPSAPSGKIRELIEGSRLKALLGALALGLLGSFGWALCAAPVVAAIFGLALGRGGLAGAPALLAVYCLGAAGPLVILAMAAQPLSRRLSLVERSRAPLARLGGLAMAGLGAWLVWGSVPL
jgi:cytochrome c biogenesis protein CcdA